MNKKLKSPLGLNPMGAGPKIIRCVIPFLLAGIVAGIFYPQRVSITENKVFFLQSAGWFWLALGVVLYAVSIKQFIKGFQKGILITTGVYRISRNPIYSGWIVFILPAIAILANNWIFLLSALVMYVALCAYIKSEETELKTLFGDQYSHYQNHVNRVVFTPKFLHR